MRFALTVLSLVGVVLASNPLATHDQQELDARAIKLSKSNKFDDLREKAYQQYHKTLKKYHVNFDEYTQKDLNPSIQELVFSSIQKAVNDEPSSPHVYWVDTAARRHDWFGLSVPGGRYSYDNPDCFYRTIPISDKHTYRIKGQRFGKGPSDVSFSLISNLDSQNTVTSLVKKDLKVHQNGSYEIIVSPKDDKSAQNHLKSNWQAKQLFIRNNLGDWSTEKPDQLSVELVGEKAKPLPSDETIIKRARHSLQAGTFFYGFGALDFKTYVNPVNTLKKPGQSQILGTLQSQAQSFGHYNLKKDEALIITLSSGESDYWVVPVTSVGMITDNPEQNIVSFNQKQAHANKNGTYTIVVSDQDPRAYNWIPTYGRSQGTVMARWQGLKTNGDGTKGIEIYTQTAPLNKLRHVLPPETKYINKGKRKQQVQTRREQYAKLHFQ